MLPTISAMHSPNWLGPLKGFQIVGWAQDPQGIYMGGNEMAMSPRSLLALGEPYRTGGVTPAGVRLFSARMDRYLLAVADTIPLGR